MPTATTPRIPFSPALEGLRGIGVAGILVYHLDVPWLAGGFLGVSTFFTLSGFLITSLLLSEYERAGRIDLRGFWARRLRRIGPAALAAVALTVVFGVFAADLVQRSRLEGDGLSALANVINWWLIATGSDYADMQGSPSPQSSKAGRGLPTRFLVRFTSAPCSISASVASSPSSMARSGELRAKPTTPRASAKTG